MAAINFACLSFRLFFTVLLLNINKQAYKSLKSNKAITMREFNHWNAILNQVTRYRKQKKADSIGEYQCSSKMCRSSIQLSNRFRKASCNSAFSVKTRHTVYEERGSCGAETDREGRAADLLENRAKSWRSFI
jgi:hypothetical protein